MEVRELADSALSRCLSLGPTRNALTGHSMPAVQFLSGQSIGNSHHIGKLAIHRKKQNKTKTKVDFWVNLKYWAKPGVGSEGLMEG